MKSTISLLIVDDEAVLRQLLQKILAREGYQIHTAEDGCAALEFLGSNQVDIVITDMKMPGMDGMELMRRVKKQYPTVGVIFMTAFGNTVTVKDALLNGADEYITKPFRSYEISMVVERAYWRVLSSSQQAPSEA